jgi:hypothetical protein
LLFLLTQKETLTPYYFFIVNKYEITEAGKIESRLLQDHYLLLARLTGNYHDRDLKPDSQRLQFG